MSAKNGRGFVLRSNADPEPIGDLSRDGDGSQAVLNEIMYTLTRRSDGFFKEGTRMHARGRPATDSTGSGSTNSADVASTRVGERDVGERDERLRQREIKDERFRQREINKGTTTRQVLERGAFKGTSFQGKERTGRRRRRRRRRPDSTKQIQSVTTLVQGGILSLRSLLMGVVAFARSKERGCLSMLGR